MRPASLVVVILGASWLAACGFIKPGTPGHEPSYPSRYNPVTEETNSGR